MITNIKPYKVLVVDDDPVIRDMMGDIFELEGYTIEVARNGREALEKLRGKGSYLVFLDLMMPVVSGQEVCEQLSTDPQVRNRHVIILMSALDNLAQATLLKVDAIMPKPFVVEDVVRVIQPYIALGL